MPNALPTKPESTLVGSLSPEETLIATGLNVLKVLMSQEMTGPPVPVKGELSEWISRLKKPPEVPSPPCHARRNLAF